MKCHVNGHLGHYHEAGQDGDAQNLCEYHRSPEVETILLHGRIRCRTHRRGNDELFPTTPQRSLPAQLHVAFTRQAIPLPRQVILLKSRPIQVFVANNRFVPLVQ